MKRPLCPVCNQRPLAVNYHSVAGQVHYRSRCEACNKKNKKVKPPVPRWQLSGYKKKLICDKCGFKARYQAQILVYHLDGNLNNSTLKNLKCVCQNCVVAVRLSDLPWKQGDLEPDL